MKASKRNDLKGPPLSVTIVTTGVISHYLTEHLDRGVLVEFAFVTAAGLAIVIGGRALG